MKFDVVGAHTVAGVEPGGTVVIDDPVQARQLVRGGHLSPAAPDSHRCPIDDCDYEGTDRGLAQHSSRSHGGDL